MTRAAVGALAAAVVLVLVLVLVLPLVVVVVVARTYGEAHGACRVGAVRRLEERVGLGVIRAPAPVHLDFPHGTRIGGHRSGEQ